MTEESELSKLRREMEDRITANEADTTAQKEAVEVKALKALKVAQDAHGVENVRAVLGGVHGFVIVKKPHPATFRKFADTDKPTMDQFDNLVRPCVVAPEPTGAEYDRLCTVLPSFTLTCAGVVSELSGTSQTKLVGK